MTVKAISKPMKVRIKDSIFEAWEYETFEDGSRLIRMTEGIIMRINAATPFECLAEDAK